MVSTYCSRIRAPVPRRSVPRVAALRAPGAIFELTPTTAESVSSALGCAKAVEAASARIATSVRMGPPAPAMMRLVAPGPQLC